MDIVYACSVKAKFVADTRGHPRLSAIIREFWPTGPTYSSRQGNLCRRFFITRNKKADPHVELSHLTFLSQGITASHCVSLLLFYWFWSMRDSVAESQVTGVTVGCQIWVTAEKGVRIGVTTVNCHNTWWDAKVSHASKIIFSLRNLT